MLLHIEAFFTMTVRVVQTFLVSKVEHKSTGLQVECKTCPVENQPVTLHLCNGKQRCVNCFPPLICKFLLCFQCIIFKEYTSPVLLLHSSRV